MNCYPILEGKDWFITDREPTICTHCGGNEIKKSVFGMPSAEDYYEAKYHFQGCILDFPEPRTWVCCNCNAAFFKNSQKKIDALNGNIRRKTKAVPEEKVYKRTEKEKADLMTEVMKKCVKDYKEQNLEIPF